jgi:hypothetical protein
MVEMSPSKPLHACKRPRQPEQLFSEQLSIDYWSVRITLAYPAEKGPLLGNVQYRLQCTVIGKVQTECNDPDRKYRKQRNRSAMLAEINQGCML